jgi:WD repeat-containing protein 40A
MPKEQCFTFKSKSDNNIHSFLWQRELGSNYSRLPLSNSRLSPSRQSILPNLKHESPIKRIIKWFDPSSLSRIDFGLQQQDSSITLLDDEGVTSSENSYTSSSIPSKKDSFNQFPTYHFQSHDDIEYFASRRLPSVFREHEYDLSGMDKVFSAAWLSDNQVVVGTKCQNLVIIDVKSNKKTLVPSMNFIQAENGLSSQCHGIHSISINPSRTLVAVGAGKPADDSKEFGIHIYCLPAFEPVAILTGHDDMVFSVSWLDDYTLVSGSRDKSVKTWKIDPLGNSLLDKACISMVKQYFPYSSEIQHEQKVRDLVFDHQTTNLFTLSADGTVNIWDAFQAKVTNSVPLSYTSETVCMALDPNEHFVSVGSQSHISIIDPRMGKITHTFDSLDDGWGVRSMTIHRGLLSIGGGLGRVSFYDLRTKKYLEWESQAQSCEKYLKSGAGWLNRDMIYQRHFQSVDVSNAVYSLVYDNSFGKLFIAGGPLQLNLKGSYAGLWK